MNILMLGNGFDLYHKLPTTYQCFLETAYLISTISETPENIACIFIELKDKCKHINTSYTQYRDFYENYSFSEEEKKKLEEIKKLSKNNCWLNYFRKTYSKDIGWIDFEKEISKVINCLSIKGFSKNVFGTGNNTAEEDSILGSFGFYCDLVPETIDDKNGGYSRRIIPPHLEPKNEYLIEYPSNSGNLILNTNLIIEKLYKELRNLAKMLVLYLDVFVEKPLFKMNSEGLVQTNNIFKNYNSIITFNYTSTYETLYEETPIHYIHGSLDKNIVLGVNPDDNDEISESSPTDTSYIMFKKYYQRVLFRTDNSFIEMINNIKDGRKAIHPEHNNLVVCGHSLDVTDQDIIKEVFDVSDSISVICHELSCIGDYVSNLIKIYGKKDFDRIRSEKQLKFLAYDEWREEQLTQAFIEGFC